MSDTNSNVKPFSEEYVIRTTVKHMRAAVKVSLDKTYSRIAEFEGNSAKSTEILSTLSKLTQIDDQLKAIAA